MERPTYPTYHHTLKPGEYLPLSQRPRPSQEPGALERLLERQAAEPAKAPQYQGR